MLIGIDIPRSSIQRIECGDRILKDYELVGFSKIFKISPNVLLANFLKELRIKKRISVFSLLIN